MGDNVPIKIDMSKIVEGHLDNLRRELLYVQLHYASSPKWEAAVTTDHYATSHINYETIKAGFTEDWSSLRPEAWPKSDALDMKESEIYEKMLLILGPNGEHWIRHQMNDGRGNFCLVGAYVQATGVETDMWAADHMPILVAKIRELHNAQGIVMFNDTIASSFDMVREILEKCYAEALEKGV